MMATYLKEIDIFTIWGNTPESWSRVVTEANLSGIPVVVRDMHDGLAEQVTRSGGGLLADTPGEFVELIQMLVENPKRRIELGEQGQWWCNRNCTTDNLKEKFTDLFLEWGLDVL